MSESCPEIISESAAVKPEHIEERWSRAIERLSNSLQLSENGSGVTLVLFDRAQSSTKFMSALQAAAQKADVDLVIETVPLPSSEEGEDAVNAWKYSLLQKFKNPAPESQAPDRMAVRIFLFDLTQSTHDQQFDVVAVLNTIRTEAGNAQGHTLILSTGDTFAKPIAGRGSPSISGRRDLLSTTDIVSVEQDRA